MPLGGHALSVVLHALVVVLLVWGAQRGAEALRDPGQGPGRGGGGGGGNRMFQVLLPSAPAAPVPAPAVAEQLVVPKQVQPLDSVIQQQAPATPALVSVPGEGPGTGAGVGPGTGSGAGSGSGSGAGSGVGPDSGGGGGRIFPPQLQGMLIPPLDGVPRELRGQYITIHFDVSERGQVLNVATEPEIRHRGYRNGFLERMRRYTFTPATLNGSPVRAPYSVRIRLG